MVFQSMIDQQEKSVIAARPIDLIDGSLIEFRKVDCWNFGHLKSGTPFIWLWIRRTNAADLSVTIKLARAVIPLPSPEVPLGRHE